MIAARKSIAQTFAELRQKKQIAFMPFISAGYPTLEATKLTLPALESAGANLIEVGIPFSDPIADGPTIQESYTVALSKKIKVDDILHAIAEVRPKVSIPLVSMVSYSIVYRLGKEKFFKQAKDAGFDGLILPDLPPPEVQPVCELVNKAGLETILLVAPTTTPQRRSEIAKLSTGFIYYLSISGITGERDRLPEDLEQNVRNLKSLTDRPVCVGFGISKADHVAQLAGVADGAIVGSALVKQIKQHENESPQSIAQHSRDFCRQLLSKVR